MLPLLVLTLVKLPPFSRFIALTVGFVYVLIARYVYNFSGAKMGLHTSRFKPSFLEMTIITLLQVMVLLAVAYWFPDWFIGGTMSQRPFNFPLWVFVFGYVFLSVPVQEVAFRGFMIPRIEMITKNPMITILLSSLIFASAHIFFRSVTLVLATFIGGIFWGYLFVKYRNLWPIQVSHAILGVVFFYLVSRHNPINQAEWHYWLNLIRVQVMALGLG